MYPFFDSEQEVSSFYNIFINISLIRTLLIYIRLATGVINQILLFHFLGC